MSTIWLPKAKQYLVFTHPVSRLSDDGPLHLLRVDGHDIKIEPGDWFKINSMEASFRVKRSYNADVWFSLALDYKLKSREWMQDRLPKTNCRTFHVLDRHVHGRAKIVDTAIEAIALREEILGVTPSGKALKRFMSL